MIVDGLFLHRDELADVWDYSVFLEVPFDLTAKRMAARDGSSWRLDDPRLARYVEGQRLYFAACRPWERATVVIENSTPDMPLVLNWAASVPVQVGPLPEPLRVIQRRFFAGRKKGLEARGPVLTSGGGAIILSFRSSQGPSL